MPRFFSTLIFLTTLASAMTAHAFNLEIKELRGEGGNLMIAVFNDPGQFPDKKPVLTKIVPVSKSIQSIIVDLNLAPGDYAISTYLDENKNGKLDTNLLRIPKELFGFSNNPRILTGPPSYQDCELRVNKDSQKKQISLLRIL